MRESSTSSNSAPAPEAFREELGSQSRGRFVNQLRRKINVTKSARFAAHWRMRITSDLVIYLTSIISLIVILVNVMTLATDDLILNSRETNFITVAISAYLIVLNLFEDRKGYMIQADALSQSARELALLAAHLEMTISDDRSQDPDAKAAAVYEASLKYGSLLEQYDSVDHSDLDYLKAKYNNYHEFYRDRYPLWFGVLASFYYDILHKFSIVWVMIRVLWFPATITTVFYADIVSWP